MSVKIYCDSCGQELTNMEFMCDIKVAEAKVVLDSRDLSNQQKTIEQKMFNVCRDCYYKKLNKTLCKSV